MGGNLILKTYQQFIAEGGNVQIGDVSADRIDLSKVDRDYVVKRLDRSLKVINLNFQRQFGLPIWSRDLFKSKEFLSGSSFHFFNKAIKDEQYRTIKRLTGDVDTQCDIAMADQLAQFLDGISGRKMGYMTFIGYKKSAGQYITLWQLEDPKINVQIDFELVDFHKGRPTPWSQFSHSSAWEDMTAGIKGVFHKYLARATTAKTLRDIVVLSGKKETPKKVKSTDLAFSVTAGLRQKIAPVMDGDKQRVMDGLPVFKEIPTKESTYITDLETMFSVLFGRKATSADMKKFNSFVGMTQLVKDYFSDSEKDAVVIGFAHTLWGAGAQGIYRGDPERDNTEKMIAYNKLLEILGQKYHSKTVDEMRLGYYKSYKS